MKPWPHKLINISFFVCCLFCSIGIKLNAQKQIKAWYAKGQVWIVWQIEQPFPETYGIYKSDKSFTNTNQATPIGRLFSYEYLPGSFILQTNNTQFTYTIPVGDSTYQLAPGEGLFVETVSKSSSSYYAVVEWGKNAVTQGINITEKAVQSNYDPINEPVQCHLQLSVKLPTGHKTNWYGLWLMGKQDESAGRPDFPVMANAYKNGMPAMFIVSEAIGMDTSNGKKIPLTHWLHGGGGNASQHMANKSSQFNIAPEKGITASHNDDLPQMFVVNGDTMFGTSRSAWFGWTRNHNIFNPGFDAGPGDTIINYTQRRILWINQWLINHYAIDPNRVALQGYSMGSGGVAALGKTFPNLFSTVSGFNNGFRRVNEETISGIQGTVEENLPTNLRNAKNESIHINEVFDLNTRISSSRDLPLFRTWAGKLDENDRMHWGPDLVAQYIKADSLGWGNQFSWDERGHTYPSLGFHWINDIPENKQTYKDNANDQERYRSNQSFPAFFNHRLDRNNHLPGSGTIGINNGDGANWGTWGGYHNWDVNTIKDDRENWSVETWLESNAAFQNDNCPENSLTADLAVRKPQFFKPVTGTKVQWKVIDFNNGNTLQEGNTRVQEDDLVVIPQITVYKENIRKVIIMMYILTPATQNEKNKFYSNIHIESNILNDHSWLHLLSNSASDINIKAIHINGKEMSFMSKINIGENRISLRPFEHLPQGIYIIELQNNNIRQSLKWVK